MNDRRLITLLFIILSLAALSCTRPNDKNINNEEQEKLEENKELEENGSGERDGYILVWEDLFNGEDLDRGAWNIEVNDHGGGNRELQYYREENVSVGKEPETGSNCLILTAKKEDFGNRHATSGRINSVGKKYFKYGKVEASIKLPKTANGLWPAFWMMGNDHPQIGWPACGEIDILEMGHSNGIARGTQDRYFNGALHWGQWHPQGHNPMYDQDFTSSYGLQDDFHLYTLIWDENSIRMYLDMDKKPDVTPYFQMAITNTDNENSPGHYFHKEFFILFNLAVGGNFPNVHNIAGITALADGEANMYVDFVKVYQKVE